MNFQHEVFFTGTKQLWIIHRVQRKLLGLNLKRHTIGFILKFSAQCFFIAKVLEQLLDNSKWCVSILGSL